MAALTGATADDLNRSAIKQCDLSLSLCVFGRVRKDVTHDREVGARAGWRASNGIHFPI